jgi:hypothetical protein
MLRGHSDKDAVLEAKPGSLSGRASLHTQDRWSLAHHLYRSFFRPNVLFHTLLMAGLFKYPKFVYTKTGVLAVIFHGGRSLSFTL